MKFLSLFPSPRSIFPIFIAHSMASLDVKESAIKSFVFGRQCMPRGIPYSDTHTKSDALSHFSLSFPPSISLSFHLLYPSFSLSSLHTHISPSLYHPPLWPIICSKASLSRVGQGDGAVEVREDILFVR